jgi:chromosome segregation ATPase
MRLLRAREGASHTSVECLVVRSKIIAHQELIAQISDEVQQASEALQNTLEKLSRFREKRRRIEDQVLDQQKEFSEAIELQKRKRSYKAFLEKRVLSLRTKVLRLQQTLNELEAQMTVNRKADSAIEPFQVNSTQSSVVENDVGGATVPAPELQRP